MFERFTERARQVVVLAQDEARALRHNYIGTEHLLLGLLREEEGLAARTLEWFGIGVEEVRGLVRSMVGEGHAAVTGQIPFTPRAKKALELGLREALSLGHKYIGTEHVLLGFLREGEGVGVEILEKLGARPAAVHDEVIRMLSGPGRREGGPPGPPPHGPRHRPPPPKHRRIPPLVLLVTGWLLFAVALGVGVLVGWAIWG
jgi:ATP-dependent Clp protease ATP-binding subunit ClpC